MFHTENCSAAHIVKASLHFSTTFSVQRRIEIVAFSKLFSNVIRMRELAMIMGTINIDARLAFHLLYFFVVLNSICSAFVPTLLF